MLQKGLFCVALLAASVNGLMAGSDDEVGDVSPKSQTDFARSLLIGEISKNFYDKLEVDAALAKDDVRDLLEREGVKRFLRAPTLPGAMDNDDVKAFLASEAAAPFQQLWALQLAEHALLYGFSDHNGVLSLLKLSDAEEQVPILSMNMWGYGTFNDFFKGQREGVTDQEARHQLQRPIFPLLVQAIEKAYGVKPIMMFQECTDKTYKPGENPAAVEREFRNWFADLLGADYAVFTNGLLGTKFEKKWTEFFGNYTALPVSVFGEIKKQEDCDDLDTLPYKNFHGNQEDDAYNRAFAVQAVHKATGYPLSLVNIHWRWKAIPTLVKEKFAELMGKERQVIVAGDGNIISDDNFGLPAEKITAVQVDGKLDNDFIAVLGKDDATLTNVFAAPSGWQDRRGSFARSEATRDAYQKLTQEDKETLHKLDKASAGDWRSALAKYLTQKTLKQYTPKEGDEVIVTRDDFSRELKAYLRSAFRDLNGTHVGQDVFTDQGTALEMLKNVPMHAKPFLLWDRPEGS